LRADYARALPLLYALAVLLPALALAGFARGAMDVTEAARAPQVHRAIFLQWLGVPPASRAFVQGLEAQALATLLALLGATLLARQWRIVRERRGGSYRIDHPARPVIARRGQSILEALRVAGIDHASVCGGRARCTTCRVRVLKGFPALPRPRKLERAALERLGRLQGVRLACQTRPRENVTIIPLLPPSTTAATLYRPGGVQGRELRVAAMFIDLRGSTSLGEQRLPYDVVFILNQFFAEMSAALVATRGHYAQFSGDGLMALYGMRGAFAAGCRDALAGAVEMMRRLSKLNERLAEELAEPLRMGIGIHAGEAIVGTMGPPNSPNLSAIGDNVNIAARLEAQTKVFDCTLVVSRVVAERAGLDLSDLARLERVSVRGRAAPLEVYALSDMEALGARIAAPSETIVTATAGAGVAAAN
jgi:adenylate cyclase